MASEGPNSGSTAASDADALGGTPVAWTNVSNILSSDDSRATASVSGTTTAEYAKATGFGFSIPAGATILGIVVEVEWNRENTGQPILGHARIVKSGSLAGTDKNSGLVTATTDTYQTFGGPTDLWGQSWTASDINSSGFGAGSRMRANGGTATEVRIDHIRITVYWEPAQAEPGAGSISVAGFAPVAGFTSKPTLGAVSVAGFAPNPFLAGAAPATGSISVAGFAPRIRGKVQKPDLVLDVNFFPIDLYTGSFSDIGADIRSGRIQRGLSRFDGVYGTSGAGRCELVLDNRSAKYDPTNTSSPYWDNVNGRTFVQPMRRFFLRADYLDTTYNLFSGFTDSWALDYPEFGQDAIVRLAGTDGVKLFSGYDAAPGSPVGSGDKIDERIARVADNVGWPSAQRDLYDDPLGGVQSTDLGGDQWRLITDAAETNLGLVYFDGAGNIVYNSLFAFPTTSVATFGDEGTDLPFESVDLAFDDVQLANEVRITATGSTEQVSSDTDSQDEYGIRTFTRTLPFLSDTAAATHADRVLELLATPELRIERITINPLSRYGLFEQVLTREIGDRITVKFGALGRTGRIERDCYIFGIEHQFDVAGQWWRTTWTLADAGRFDDLSFV